MRSKLFKKAEGIDSSNLPRHIAIIMDGNGRWAKKRALPRSAGHAAGAEVFRTIATYCKNIGIGHLTVYAFSTENWKRPKDEVDGIMRLLEKYLKEAIEKMRRDNIRLKFFGDTSVVPERLRALIAETDEISKTIDGFQANICLNYGGRDEIVNAAKIYAEKVKYGAKNNITEEEFASLLYSKNIPDPDLIIRPGGEMRLSNFLLYQSAYSELIFTPKLWPDFKPKDIDEAIAIFQTRERRFGAAEK